MPESTALAAGISNVSPKTLKEAPSTSQNADDPSNVSSHCTGFSLDTLSKVLLQDRLANLEDLIRGEDGQAVSLDLQNLVLRVLGEIGSWLNREGAMSFEAQITLSNMANNGPTNNNQSSCKNEKYLLASYHFLIRSATSNDRLANEKRRMLSDLLCESEEFIKEPENAMTDEVHHDELNLLHETCDGDIAFHSVELAIRIILEKGQRQTLLPWQLHNQGLGLLNRFENLRNIEDLEKAIVMQRKAIISAPLNNVDRPMMLSSLGTSYQHRYELFKDVEDIESAIRQQFKAVASAPRDSIHRYAVLTNFGNAYFRRFQRSGERKDIDFAIDQILEAVNTRSSSRARSLGFLGNLYQLRFARFGDTKDLDSAIERLLEAVVPITLNGAERAVAHTNLGNSYLRRFERFRAMKDIDSAIEQLVKASTFVPLNSVNRPGILDDLGNSYQRRFEWFGNLQDLESLIEHRLKAVASTPLNHPNRPSTVNNLGISYQLRFKRFGKKEDIDFAIEQQLKAVASTPPDSPKRAGYLNILGTSYLERFIHSGEVNDNDSAIKQHLEALDCSLPNSAERVTFLCSLGLSYLSRFLRFGKKEDIDLAIKKQFEAIASSPSPPDILIRAKCFNSLGNSYLHRFRHFGEVNDIDSAINQHLETFQLACSLPNGADRATFLHDLGLSYQTRFEYSGDVKDMDSAIERHLEAIASIPLDSPLQLFLGSLGTSYRSRFLRFGEVKDIDLAIKYQLEAVTSTPPESANRGKLLNNLGTSYKSRFNRLGEMKDINSSIELLGQAVFSISPDDPQHPIVVDNLGGSYMARFKHSGDMEDIDLAIKEQVEAVGSIPIDSPHRSRLLGNLAKSYFERFSHSEDMEDIDLAIKQELEAVASAPLGSANRPKFINNLGNSYLYRFQRSGKVKDIDFAIENLVEAVATIPPDSADRPMYLYNLGNSYLFRFRSKQEPTGTDLEESFSKFRLASFSPKGLPSIRIMASLQWADLAHKLDKLVSASEAYDQAIRLLPQVAWIGLNAIAQLKELSSDIQSLGCNAAACMIALAQAEPHNRQHHLGRAIELLDQGRSILWSQTSNFKRDLEDLRGVNSNLASDLDNVGKFLAQGCFRDPKDPLSETDARLYRQYAEKWEEHVRYIRGLPDFHDFLLPSPISTLQTAAAEGPVVIINSSEFRRDAVIVRAKGDLVLVPLPDITVAELESLVNQQAEFTSRKSKSVAITSNNYSRSSETLEQVLNRTWLLVGEPIARKLEELGLVRGSEKSSKSRVWWCLTGSLSFLPIHASFPPTKPGIQGGMMDIVVSSYTPTLSTLLRARQRIKIERPGFRMLAVGQSSIAGMMPLPGVTEEIAFIQKILGVEALTLQGCKATVDGVAASLPTCLWAHFACHGIQDPNKPMDSGLVMWDNQRLTLSRLAQSSLASAEFAFLSSCESAKGSKQFPNEAMHLTAGLQFIGYRGVIGTMWSVGDKDALSVATQVYGELFKDGTGQASASNAALALHRAVLFLRATNVPLARWVPFVHFGL